MFLKKIGELLSGMSDVFGISGDILRAGFDELVKDHDETSRVLCICRQVNLKLNKDKCLFKFTSIPFFGQIISPQGMSPYQKEVQVLTEMPPPKTKKEMTYMNFHK